LKEIKGFKGKEKSGLKTFMRQDVQPALCQYLVADVSKVWNVEPIGNILKAR